MDIKRFCSFADGRLKKNGRGLDMEDFKVWELKLFCGD